MTEAAKVTGIPAVTIQKMINTAQTMAWRSGHIYCGELLRDFNGENE